MHHVAFGNRFFPRATARQDDSFPTSSFLTHISHLHSMQMVRKGALFVPFTIRNLWCLVAGLLLVGPIGCNVVPNHWLRTSQLRSQQIYARAQTAQQQADAANSSLAAINGQKQSLAQKNRELADRLNLANSRLDNLNSENNQLQQKVVSLLDRTRGLQNPLSDSATRKFEKLDEIYKGFNFDPETGVSKFSSDILFDSGSSNIKSSARPLLAEFSKILNEGEARHLNILVVGHTDDKPISKASTRKTHPTNWHLSTNRANAVVERLKSYKLAERRMGVSGYSMFQPLKPNTTDKNRSENRRVEIFVLAPDAAVAGWDPLDSTTR
jgi:chemotaxis protein MotB